MDNSPAQDHPLVKDLHYVPRTGWRGWLPLHYLRLDRLLARPTELTLRGELPNSFAPAEPAEAAEPALARSAQGDATAQNGRSHEEASPDDTASHETGPGETRSEENQPDEPKIDHRFVPCVITDAGAGRLTNAQEKTLRYLIDHERKVVGTLLQQLTELCRNVSQSTPADERLDLAELVEAGLELETVLVSADAFDGLVPTTFVFTLSGKSMRGLNIKMLGDRPFYSEKADPFPVRLPELPGLLEVSPDQAGVRRVELKIHGRWSGIYHVDQENVCQQREDSVIWWGQPTPWDEEGLEQARAVPWHHRLLQKLPLQMVLPLSLGPNAWFFCPLLIVMGLLIWPGLFWASLIAALGGLASLAFLLRRQLRLRTLGRSHVFWALSLQAAASASGLWAWNAANPFTDGFGLWVLEWGIWSGCAAVALAALWLALSLPWAARGQFDQSPVVLSAPPFLFGALLAVALWLSVSGSFTPLHLLWILPVLLASSILLTAGLSLAGRQ